MEESLIQLETLALTDQIFIGLCSRHLGDPARHRLDHRSCDSEEGVVPLGLHVLQARRRDQPQGETDDVNQYTGIVILIGYLLSHMVVLIECFSIERDCRNPALNFH